MFIVEPGGTHIMTFPYDTAGLPVGSWTVKLFKNRVPAERPVQLGEQPDGYYTFSFSNDGTPDVMWTAIINETGVQKYFHETWKVEKPVVAQGVKELRAQATGFGGYFGGNK